MRYYIAGFAVLAVCSFVGSRLPAQTVTIAPPPAWRVCAVEDATCASRAGALVRYGAGNSYTHRVVNGAVKCSNTTFGDPAPNVVKSCLIASPAASSPTPSPKPTPTPEPAPAPTPAPMPAPSPTPAAIKLGINVGGVAYWSAESTFANQAAILEWRIPAEGWAYAPADRMRNGTPITIEAGRGMLAFLTPPAAAFRGEGPTTSCTWSGKGLVSIASAGRIVSTGTGMITFEWPKTKTPMQTVTINIGATDAGDPIRDIDCREPNEKGVFSSQLLDYLKPFGVLRFLDWSSANGNPASVTWATRGKAGTNVTGGSDGFPLEHQIGLANAVNAGAWFTIPWNADADYHRRAAQLVHDTIPAGRPVYVEVSNEVWNYQFGQTTQAQKEGLAAKLSDNAFQAALYRYAQKITEVMPIWAEVFKDRPADLVRIMATQSGNPWTGQVIMDWNGGAVAKHIDAIAIAPYFFVDIAGMGDDHEQNMAWLSEAADREIAGSVKTFKALADKHGKKLVAYEAGQHMIDPDNETRRIKMQRDPRMEAIYARYIKGWRDAGGDVMNLYSATGSISRFGSWGLREYAGQPIAETPKLRGVLDFAGNQ